MKRAAWIAIVLLFAVGVGLWWTSRPREDDPAKRSVAPQLQLARERAAAEFKDQRYAAAREAIAPFATLEEAALEDVVRAAIIEYADREKGAPEPWFDRIRARDPSHPSLRFMLARRALADGRFDEAIQEFRLALAREPKDLGARVGLAATLADLDRHDEARELLEGVVAEGIEHAGAWYVQAVYRLSQLAYAREREAEGQRWASLHQQLAQMGLGDADPAQLDFGELARVQPPGPSAPIGRRAPVAPSFHAARVELAGFGQAIEWIARDLDGDGEVDLLAAGPDGLWCAFRAAALLRGEAPARVERLFESPVTRVRAVDFGNRDALDLCVVAGGALTLLEQRSGAELLLDAPGGSRWKPSPLSFAPLTGEVADLAPVDFDHDGDLDLLLVGAFGARLLRNDGVGPRPEVNGVAPARGAFVDVSAEAGLSDRVAFTWCAIEDLDDDQDVDLLLGSADELHVMDSLRGGRFAEVAVARFGARVGMAHEPLLADLDADGRCDLLEPGAAPRLWRQAPDRSFRAEAFAANLPAGSRPSALDLDLDGTTDVVSAAGALLGVDGPAPLALVWSPMVAAGAWVAADWDHDLDVDVLRAEGGAIQALRCEGAVGKAARLAPLGLKDNRNAVGAVVEVRTAGLYRRIFWSGSPEWIGCGEHPSIDVVRVTWPNGVVQAMFDVPPREQPFLDAPAKELLQPVGLVGSCPFLYSHDGSRMVFVTDVLGGTPLGLPMAPGMLVPPDHDEYVKVSGEQLRERDGVFELAITEELREVTYLDRVRLDVVDHPADVRVEPNERFCFPPFPQAHLHTIDAPLAALRATGSDGRDWTQELARVDDVHAQPMVALEPQLLGLAQPHWLELEFDPVRVRDAAKLRLICTGWFLWSDASVNMASARTPGVAFVPPILQVPGPGGTWIDSGPPIGFPAGKSKTMVIELGELLDRERPRLRLFSTLRLYWDAIHLAVDADDAPRRVSALEATRATLFFRGFSRAIESGRADLPERFDWDALESTPRWNQHPGRYTRYGDVRELLDATDDRFVILGSGDALLLNFDARACPPLPDGWSRDFLVYLDGWAKDRDPNTVDALHVEPLPFHGMSGYPYRDDERFPDGEEHRRWREEWNTREGQPWIAPLSPRRERDWALGN